MANLSIRKLDEETLTRLRKRAADQGVSMEEEARRILREAVAAPEKIGDLAVRTFGPTYGVDLECPSVSRMSRWTSSLDCPRHERGIGSHASISF